MNSAAYLSYCQVPTGIWEIFSTRKACCNSNFPYSEYCDADPEGEAPTKHPTIAMPEDDLYEVIPIKFDINGLPNDISMRELKNEMKSVLKRILLRLTDAISGLKVTEVEERVVATRRGRMLVNALRRLRDETIYFNVYVVRDDDKKFGPLIIQEIRDSYNEVLEQIQ